MKLKINKLIAKKAEKKNLLDLLEHFHICSGS